MPQGGVAGSWPGAGTVGNALPGWPCCYTMTFHLRLPGGLWAGADNQVVPDLSVGKARRTLLAAMTSDPAGAAARPATWPVTGASAASGMPLRLMAVHAHPDDESSKGAATMARYAREGADVLVCTLTGGERGDILNKAMDRPEIRADLPAVRRAEMARAREILGVRQQFLGFIDSGLPEGDPRVPAARDPPLRRTRRLSASGSRQDPRGLRGSIRRGRRPRPAPGLRRALAAAQAVLLRQLPPGPLRGTAPGDGTARPGVAVRGADGQLG